MTIKPLCFCAFVLTGCETLPRAHQEPGRDVYKSWAVTGCVNSIESARNAMPRGKVVQLCRGMTDLFKKGMCKPPPIPVSSSERAL